MDTKEFFVFNLKILCFELTFKITNDFVSTLWFLKLKKKNTLKEVRLLMARGRKVEAIKLARSKFNIGLREAKHFVEQDESCTPTEKERIVADLMNM